MLLLCHIACGQQLSWHHGACLQSSVLLIGRSAHRCCRCAHASMLLVCHLTSSGTRWDGAPCFICNTGDPSFVVVHCVLLARSSPCGLCAASVEVNLSIASIPTPVLCWCGVHVTHAAALHASLL
jgi:hypothetical protein